MNDSLKREASLGMRDASNYRRDEHVYDKATYWITMFRSDLQSTRVRR